MCYISCFYCIIYYNISLIIINIDHYHSLHYNNHSFGLTAETLLDKAIALKYLGGSYGGNLKPTHFICLILKMLQLQPEKDIIH